MYSPDFCSACRRRSAVSSGVCFFHSTMRKIRPSSAMNAAAPDAPGSIHVKNAPGCTAIAMCPRYGKKQFVHDAAYIAALSPSVVLALLACVEAAKEVLLALDVPPTECDNPGCECHTGAPFYVALAALESAP